MSAYDTEKDSWALPHRLNVDMTRRENDLLRLIDKAVSLLPGEELDEHRLQALVCEG